MTRIGHNRGGGRVYAITFDLDTKVLEEAYEGKSWQNAYAEIRHTLGKFGFDWRQGSVYFGDETVDAVTCVLAVQELTTRFAWFRPSVRDIRMLRIEENNDLGPALERAAKFAGG